MLNKNLKTLSNFLRKEKVSVISGVCLGVIITLGSMNGDNLINNSTVTAQSVDATVLNDNDVRNSLSKNVIPSDDELNKIESEHVVVSVNEQLFLKQGYDSMIYSAEKVQTSYTTFVEEQNRISEKQRLAEEAVNKRQAEESGLKTKSETFKVTGYCNCSKCCGKWSPEVTGRQASTCSGTTPCEGRTVAVDPDVIPLGSTVIINGESYIAEDTGSAVKGNVVDIYFDSHSDALIWGCQYIEVTYIIK